MPNDYEQNQHSIISDTTIISEQNIVNQKNEPAYIAYALGGILVTMTILLSMTKIIDDDVFWHLATGRWMCEHYAIPDHDIFGIITFNQLWYPLEWGWSVLTYVLSTIGGVFALQLLTVVIWATIAILMITPLRKMRIATIISAAFTSIAIIVASGRMAARPQLITVLGLSLVMYIVLLEIFSEDKQSRRLYILPIIFLVWTNMHPGVLAGIVIVLLFLFSECVVFMIRKKRRHQSVLPTNEHFIKKLSIVSTLCVGAILVNPHGIGSFTYMAEHAQMNFLSAITEWTPTLQVNENSVTLWLYKFLLIIGSLNLWHSLRKRNPFFGLLYIVFALYSLRAVHFVADFAVVLAPITAVALSQILQASPSALRRALLHRGIVILFAVVLLYVCWYIPHDSLQAEIRPGVRFGFGIDSTRFPLHAIDFVKHEHIRGRPFNQFNVGGLLIWTVPEEKNFIDSRDLNDWIAKEYSIIMNMQPGFKQRFTGYGIDYVILHLPDLRGEPSEMNATPIPYLSTLTDEWKLVYWDDVSFVYVKNISKFRVVIEKFEYRVLHPYLFVFRATEFDSLRKAQPDLFLQEVRRKISEEPNGKIIRFITHEVGFPVSPDSSH